MKKIIFIILSIFIFIILVILAFNSDFAKIKNYNKNKHFSMNGKYNFNGFVKNHNNKNILFLGEYTISLKNKRKKLSIKLSIKASTDIIDLIILKKVIIRNDVIRSIYLNNHIKNIDILKKDILNTLNSRLEKEKIQDIYIEEFIIK